MFCDHRSSWSRRGSRLRSTAEPLTAFRSLFVSPRVDGRARLRRFRPLTSKGATCSGGRWFRRGRGGPTLHLGCGCDQTWFAGANPYRWGRFSGHDHRAGLLGLNWRRLACLEGRRRWRVVSCVCGYRLSHLFRGAASCTRVHSGQGIPFAVQGSANRARLSRNEGFPFSSFTHLQIRRSASGLTCVRRKSTTR